MEGGGLAAARRLRIPRGLFPRHLSAPAASRRQRREWEQLVVCPEPEPPAPHDGPPAAVPRAGSWAARVDGFVGGVSPQVSLESPSGFFKLAPGPLLICLFLRSLPTEPRASLGASPLGGAELPC